jgi:hypothetical protein
MMRLMQSMVPTQEPPAVQFQLSKLVTIRTDGASEWKYVFQPSAHSKNKIQSRWQPVSFVAIKERLYL